MKNLTEFGWCPHLTPTEQRTLLQQALDTGDAIYLKGVCEVDGPVFMDQPQGVLWGPGTIYCQVNCDVLTIRADHCTVEGIAFLGVLARQGAAVTIGPKLDGDFVTYVTLDRLVMPLIPGSGPDFDYGHSFGVHARKFGGLTIRGGMIGGRSALRWDNEVVDTGDSKIIGADINASNLFDYPNQRGMGLYWTAGGGLYVQNCKFNQGKYHARIESALGNTGSLMFQDNSFEGNVDAAIDLMGSVFMNRVHIQGNSIGVQGRAIAVRNFAFPSGTAGPWLHGLVIDGNTIEAGFNGMPLMEIGCATDPLIGPNRLQGRGTDPVPAGIIVYPQCVGGKLDAAGSIITGCSPAIDNQGTGMEVISSGGGTTALGQLTDVDMTGAMAGQYLQYQGDGIVRPDTPS